MPVEWKVMLGVQPVSVPSLGTLLVQTMLPHGTCWNGSLVSNVNALKKKGVSVVRLWLSDGTMTSSVGGVLSATNDTTAATDDAPNLSVAIARTVYGPGLGRTRVNDAPFPITLSASSSHLTLTAVPSSTSFACAEKYTPLTPPYCRWLCAKGRSIVMVGRLFPLPPHVPPSMAFANTSGRNGSVLRQSRSMGDMAFGMSAGYPPQTYCAPMPRNAL